MCVCVCMYAMNAFGKRFPSILVCLRLVFSKYKNVSKSNAFFSPVIQKKMLKKDDRYCRQVDADCQNNTLFFLFGNHVISS
jgi:hypothetical protein